REEIDRLVTANDGLAVYHTLTREKPKDWTGYTRRIDAAMVQEVAWPKTQQPAVFVCGPTPSVEAAADLLVVLDSEAQRIKTDRARYWLGLAGVRCLELAGD